MRAFIAGATGYTGQQVVRQWCALGHEAVAHLRPGSVGADSLKAALEAEGVANAKIVEVPWALEALVASLREVQPQVVFFLIGTTKARMKALKAQGLDAEAASYEAVDYGLAKLLLDALMAAQLPQTCFVYLSSMGVSATAPGAYLKVRWRFERELIASGQPYVIARPGIITGEDREDDRPMERLSGAVSAKLFGLLGGLGAASTARRYRPTDAQELAQALVGAALDQRFWGQILEAQQLKADAPDGPKP